MTRPCSSWNPATATRAIREYAIECAISKVFGSEAADHAVDDLVQIHGGCGYVKGFGTERTYRDSRINRIFEGTNEINRLLITGELMKKAAKGILPLFEAGQKLKEFLLEYSPFMLELPDTPLAYQIHMSEMIKKSILLVCKAALDRFGDAVRHEQEILSRISDMIICSYALDSALRRAVRALDASSPQADFHELCCKCALDAALPGIAAGASQVLHHCLAGDDLAIQRASLRKLLKYNPIDQIGLQRSISKKVIAKAGYPLYN